MDRRQKRPAVNVLPKKGTATEKEATVLSRYADSEQERTKRVNIFFKQHRSEFCGSSGFGFRQRQMMQCMAEKGVGGGCPTRIVEQVELAKGNMI